MQNNHNVSDNPDNFVYHIMGYNRTGKTTTAQKILKTWRKSHPRGTALKFDPQEKFVENNATDIFIYSNEKEFYSDIYTYNIDEKTGKKKYIPKWNKQDGAILILDDYRLLNESDKADQWLKTVLQFKAAWNLDIIFICHSPLFVLRYVTQFVTHWLIFYTKAEEGNFDERVTEVALCNKCNNFMRTYVLEFKTLGKYPNFPHLIVVTSASKILTQNISKSEYKYIISKMDSPNKKK